MDHRRADRFVAEIENKGDIIATHLLIPFFFEKASGRLNYSKVYMETIEVPQGRSLSGSIHEEEPTFYFEETPQ